MDVDKTLHQEAGWKYLLLALGAFAGLGIEALYAFWLEPLIYGRALIDFTTADNIRHWIITCVSWGIVGFVLIRIGKEKAGFDVFENGEKLSAWRWIAAAGFVVFSFAADWFDWSGFKCLKEFQYNGWLKFIFQYIYYMFETALYSLIIIYGQKAFEKWTKHKNIPWGGILCALTWGAGHILTKGSVITGLWTTLAGFMFGAVYLLLNRDAKKAYLFLFLMLVL